MKDQEQKKRILKVKINKMQTGLNSWLGRFIKRAIVKVAGLVDSYLNTSTFGISSEIGSFQSWADDIGSGGSSFWNNRLSNNTSNSDNLDSLSNDPRGNYEPTELEAIELEKFSDKFTEIITDISKEQLNVITVFNSGASNIYKYSLINALLQRITVVREYYKYNQVQYLSSQAIELRNLMIDVLLAKIINEIEDLGWKNTNYELTSSSVSIPSGNAIPELSPFPVKTSTKLLVNTYLFTEAKANNLDLVEVVNPTDDTTTDTGTVITTPTTETPKPKKRGGGLIAGLLFGAAVLIIANSDDDDKKKNKPKQK